METESTFKTSIIVVGAGIAGIKCAHTLIQNNKDLSIMIIDGNKYIGGRLCKSSFCGNTIELGANWVHGIKNKAENPLWTLTKKAKLKGIHWDEYDEDYIARSPTGENLDKEFGHKWDQLEKIVDKLYTDTENGEFNEKKDSDWASELAKNGWQNAKEAIDKCVEWALINETVDNHPERASVFHEVDT